MRRPFLRVCETIVLVVVGLGCVLGSAAAKTSVSPTADAGFDALISSAKVSMMTDPAATLRSARSAEVAAARANGPHSVAAVATALWLQGEADLRLNNLAGARPLIDRALSLTATVGQATKLNGDLLLSKGALETATADVAGALAAYQRAHNIFRDIGETRSRAIALISIATLYQEAEDRDNALKYYGQALDVYRGDPQLLFSIYGNRGILYGDMGDLSKAQAELGHALEIARSLKSSVLEARTLRNIARSQLFAGQIDAADRTIARGFKVAQGDDAATTRSHFLVLSAWSARLHDHLPEAERLIAHAFASIDPSETTLDLREGHKTAYDIYKKAGKESQALAHLEALKALDEKTATLTASTNTSLAAARFDFANQDLKIEKLKGAQLQRDIEDTKLRARTQLEIFGGVAVATVIIVALLAFGLVTIRRSRNEVRAANVDLGETNTALGKALAAKTEFLATTSHEIRTPLNGILGMTQVMLADATLTEKLRDRIGVVHGAGVTMRALVDDILDVAKMETGNLTIERVPFDLKATLRDVSRMWEEQAHGKGLSFMLDLDDCPLLIEGDAARLRQIAFNLLSNALKFTTIGGVSLKVSANDTRLSIAVSDSGIGIPTDKLGIIFESFRQVDAGTTRQFGGTGLGLAICQNLAHAMDGDVTVTSVPGQGSTFTLDLPLLIAAPPEVVATGEAPAPSALLILDRNPISRSMLRAVLEARAGTVVFASSVAEAVALIAEGGIANVLIDDATIKAADDLDAALLALGSTAAASSLLWVAPDEADRARFAAGGIDQVIAKPIAGVALAALIYDILSDNHNAPFELVTQAA